MTMRTWFLACSAPLALAFGCAVAPPSQTDAVEAVDSPVATAASAVTAVGPVASATDEALAALRFGISFPCEHPNEDASASGGYQVVVGAPTGDVVGPSYARSALVAEAGQGFGVRLCNTRPSYGGIGLLESVELSYKVDGGPVTTVSVLPQVTQLPPDYWADSAAYVVPVPKGATGVLSVWAKVNVSGGKSYWVSRNGANFNADVVPAAQSALTFPAPTNGTWAAPTASAPLQRGAALRLRYDTARMVAIMGKCQGQHTADYVPGTEAFVSFRDAGGNELVRYGVDAATDAPVEIPGAAASVAIWVRGSCANDYVQRTAWDSSFGQNFVFPIAAR